MKLGRTYQQLRWDYKNANFHKFREELSNTNFEEIIEMQDINVACEGFTNEILKKAKDCIPNKLVSIKPNSKPWFTSELKKLLRRKDRAHTKAKKVNTPELWGKFKSIRNTYKRN